MDSNEWLKADGQAPNREFGLCFLFMRRLYFRGDIAFEGLSVEERRVGTEILAYHAVHLRGPSGKKLAEIIGWPTENTRRIINSMIEKGFAYRITPRQLGVQFTPDAMEQVHAAIDDLIETADLIKRYRGARLDS